MLLLGRVGVSWLGHGIGMVEMKSAPSKARHHPHPAACGHRRTRRPLRLLALLRRGTNRGGTALLSSVRGRL